MELFDIQDQVSFSRAVALAALWTVCVSWSWGTADDSHYGSRSLDIRQQSGWPSRSWRHSRGIRCRAISCATMMLPTGRSSLDACGRWAFGIDRSHRDHHGKTPIERLIGTIRHDCLDHILIFGETHLRRVLTLYSLYYNQTRTHLGLSKDTPLGRAVQRSGSVVATPILSGLASSLCTDMIFGNDNRARFPVLALFRRRPPGRVNGTVICRVRIRNKRRHADYLNFRLATRSIGDL